MAQDACRRARVAEKQLLQPISARVPEVSSLLQVLELQGTELKLQHEVEKTSSLKCATFGASNLQERHLATGNYTGALTAS